MAVGDQDVQKQIEQMIALIDQEANEKVEEIEIKMAEEFNIKKNTIVEKEIKLINKYYKKKEEQVQTHECIQAANTINHIKLKLLEAQSEQVKNVFLELKGRLKEVTLDEEKYSKILEQLLIQGVYRLLEPDVTIQIREEDSALLQKLLPGVIKKCEEKLGTVNIKIDSTFLPSDTSGGVKMFAKFGKMKLNNTLESRLELFSSQLIPQIRTAFYGPNAKRHYED